MKEKFFSIVASLVTIMLMYACSGQDSTIEGTSVDPDPIVTYQDYDGYSIVYVLQGSDTIGQLRLDLKYLVRTRAKDDLGKVALLSNYPVRLENGVYHWLYDDAQEGDLEANGCQVLEAEYKDYTAVPQTTDRYHMALQYGVRFNVTTKSGQTTTLGASVAPRYYQVAEDLPDPDPIVTVHDFDGYSVVYFVQDNDTIARLRFDLEKLEIKLDEIGSTSVNAGYPVVGNGVWKWLYVDTQAGDLSATGATITEAKYLDYLPTLINAERVQLALRHQVKGEVTTKGNRKFAYDVTMAPRYFQYCEKPEYIPTMDWSISTTATQTSLTCKVGVTSSDGSFNKVYSWRAAVAGLESYRDTLYVGSTTDVATGNYVGVMTDEKEEKPSKDGVWFTVKRNYKTKDAVKFLMPDGKTEVGPGNEVDYYITSLTCHLPNGEDVLWEVIPETTVDPHTYTDEGLKSFTMADGSYADYWKTLHTGVHHFITIKVTYKGESRNLEIPCLTAKGGGKYLLTENACAINVFVKK